MSDSESVDSSVSGGSSEASGERGTRRKRAGSDGGKAANVVPPNLASALGSIRAVKDAIFPVHGARFREALAQVRADKEAAEKEANKLHRAEQRDKIMVDERKEELVAQSSNELSSLNPAVQPDATVQVHKSSDTTKHNAQSSQSSAAETSQYSKDITMLRDSLDELGGKLEKVAGNENSINSKLESLKGTLQSLTETVQQREKRDAEIERRNKERENEKVESQGAAVAGNDSSAKGEVGTAQEKRLLEMDKTIRELTAKLEGQQQHIAELLEEKRMADKFHISDSSEEGESSDDSTIRKGPKVSRVSFKKSSQSAIGLSASSPAPLTSLSNSKATETAPGVANVDIDTGEDSLE